MENRLNNNTPSSASKWSDYVEDEPVHCTVETPTKRPQSIAERLTDLIVGDIRTFRGDFEQKLCWIRIHPDPPNDEKLRKNVSMRVLTLTGKTIKWTSHNEVEYSLIIDKIRRNRENKKSKRLDNQYTIK